jgi:hypothetical protein
MPLVAILGVALSATSRSVGDAAIGLAAAALLAVLQYTARRLGGPLEQIHRTTPFRMTSSTVPDCFAMLQAIIGLAALVGLTLRAVQTGSISLVLPGMAVFIVCWYSAMAAINLQALHVTITSAATVKEEALGIVALFLKIVVRLTPVLFGVGVGWGILKTVVAYVLLYVPVHETKFAAALLGGEVPATAVALSGRMLSAQVAYGQAITILLAAAAAPLLIYVGSLVCGLGLEALRALIALSNVAEKRSEPNDDDSAA